MTELGNYDSGMHVVNGSLAWESSGKNGAFDFTKEKSADTVSADFNLTTIRLGSRIRMTVVPRKPTRIQAITLTMGFEVSNLSAVFSNGFQSWSESREYRPTEKMRGMCAAGHLFKLDRIGDYRFVRYPRKPGRFISHGYTYFKKADGRIVLVGSVCEAEGYTIFDIDTHTRTLMVRKECEGMILSRPTVLLDLVILEGPEQDVFASFFAEKGISAQPKKTLTGWTSWYQYYTDISEEILIDNLRQLREKHVPIDVFQIDDGYQTSVGDWLSIKPSFPSGMKYLADSAREAGFMPGIWLAPFVCSKHSLLYKEHTEWLLKDSSGRPVPAGWIPLWGGTAYALDIFHGEVRSYLRSVFATVFEEWGFDLVKLDFLYAAALVPHRGRTRGQIMAEALAFLRELLGGRTAIGCGVPLWSSAGMFECCRIGSDVALKWEDRLLRRLGYRERVSTINSLRSTIGRRQLGGHAFLNDPDVFILRNTGNSLDLKERYTLFLLNNIFGQILLCSDSVASYGPEEYDLYRSMFPLRQKTILSVQEESGLHLIRFLCGTSSYIAFANLGERDASAPLPEGVYFSSGGFEQNQRGGYFLKGSDPVKLAAHASCCFLEVPEKPFAVAGSAGHLFPGCEIETVLHSDCRIYVTFHPKANPSGLLSITVPDEGVYTVNGKQARSLHLPDGQHAVCINVADIS